jgi:hypothetical protein
MMRELWAARFHRVSPLAWLVALAAAATSAADAQGFRIRPTAQPEIRAFASAASDWSVGAGVGFNVPAGYYLRVAPMLIAGRRLTETPRDFARVEVVGRFSLDPFRQSRWGPWAGAGLAAEWERDVAGRALVVLALGTDLPGTAGWKPTVELAIGGGTRVSLGFKPVRRAGR